jgi:hypothetical protein
VPFSCKSRLCLSCYRRKLYGWEKHFALIDRLYVINVMGQEPRMGANTRESNKDLILRDEVFRIIGASMNVSNGLGSQKAGMNSRPFASIRG